MKRFDLVATGGTFDVIHDGHIALLSESFEISKKVIIGLTGDELASKKQKKLANGYSKRFKALSGLVEERFPRAKYQISKLDDDFGPAVLEGDVEALVVSDETRPQGDVLNRLRSEKNLSKVEIVVVPMVLAEDGSRISTTRIRSSEIDPRGKLS